ncbi:MAG: ABC transporter permease [Candidatus Eremiobacteraeota bacterium]|nr:ABC transporter permease [Candidatus Eremiobacteraeota bacterium]
MNAFITVLSAEIMRRIRSRPFLLGVALGIFAIALMIKAPALLGGALTHASDAIVLGGPPALTSRGAELLKKDFEIEATTTKTDAPTMQYLDSHNKAGALVVLGAANRRLTVTVYARNLSFVNRKTLKTDLMPLNLAMSTSASVAAIDSSMNIPIVVQGVDTKFTSEQASDAAQAIAYTLLFFLYISILINSQLVMTSVAEEKTSRIAELLIASVNPTSLLAGKIAAAAVLAVIQMASWLVVGYFLSGGTSAPAHGSDVQSASAGFGAITANISQLDIFAFIAYFVLGFLQLSTLFAAFASMINRTEDLGSVQMPLVMPVVAALFIAIYALGFPNSPLVVATSFIPIISPFTMFARIAVSVVPLWQIAVSLLINIAAVYFIAIAAGKIYRVGMMLYGRPPKLSQMWATLRG